jgi:TolB-like protein
MSAEGNQGYFSDGIAEEILNALAHVNGLKVASRTSSFQFRKSDLGIPALSITQIFSASSRIDRG